LEAKVSVMKVLAGIACGVLTACTSQKQEPEPPPPAEAQAPGSWTVTPAGVGPVRFGMTVANARAALRDSLAGVPADGSCVLVAPPGTPAGVTLMVENGQVVRADVESETIATDHGARVGHSEVVVKERYGDSLVSTPHKYDEKGRYLTFVPPGPDGSRLRVIFETDGIRVKSYRAGILPAVEYVERCG
jgi:hypothetical protein